MMPTNTPIIKCSILIISGPLGVSVSLYFFLSFLLNITMSIAKTMLPTKDIINVTIVTNIACCIPEIAIITEINAIKADGMVIAMVIFPTIPGVYFPSVVPLVMFFCPLYI